MVPRVFHLDPAFSTIPRVFHETPRFPLDPASSTRPRVFHENPRFPPDHLKVISFLPLVPKFRKKTNSGYQVHCAVSVCMKRMLGACLKWFFLELSFFDCWSRGTRLWKRDRRWNWIMFALSTFCPSYLDYILGIGKYSWRQRELLAERFITIRCRKCL